MSIAVKYVGLDVSKAKIAVAIADEGSRSETRYWGTIVHSKAAIAKLMQQLSREDVKLQVCYEAGPTGYMLYRWLLELGVDCIIVAPSLIPKKPGDKVKTDKRDALRLAQLYRAGELTTVYVPTPEDEAFRDLVRAREDAKEDLNRHQQRLGKLLLRLQISDPNGSKPRSSKYEVWLDTVQFSNNCQRLVFQEYRQAIFETKERIKRYEAELEKQAIDSKQTPLIQAFQALRGVALVTASTLTSEIASISRFASPTTFMSYCGLVPSESSSGERRWQGKITKAGNAHLRRVLVEAAWGYRYSPAVKKQMRERISGLPATIQAIAWTAQNRLNKKYKSMLYKGKHKGCIVTAIARELAGFAWAIAKELDKIQLQKEMVSCCK